MFWFFRWLFISLALTVLAIAMAFGLKQVQNKYCPAYQYNEFAGNDFTGNRGSVKEAIQNAIVLLEKKQYGVFLKSYIPEKGKEKFVKDGTLVSTFVNGFKKAKADKMLRVLRSCASQNYKTSDALSATCVLKEKVAGKSSMTFFKEKGSWRIGN